MYVHEHLPQSWSRVRRLLRLKERAQSDEDLVLQNQFFKRLKSERLHNQKLVCVACMFLCIIVSIYINNLFYMLSQGTENLPPRGVFADSSLSADLPTTSTKASNSDSTSVTDHDFQHMSPSSKARWIDSLDLGSLLTPANLNTKSKQNLTKNMLPEDSDRRDAIVNDLSEDNVSSLSANWYNENTQTPFRSVIESSGALDSSASKTTLSRPTEAPEHISVDSWCSRTFDQRWHDSEDLAPEALKVATPLAL